MMPVWVRGNQCFMITTTAYDIGSSVNPQIEDVVITNTLVNSGTSVLVRTPIFQPGVIRGFNMYVGTNTSNKDATLSLLHGKWNGGTGHPITTTVLFTIPAGETGYFCMDPSLIAESVRTWKARDEIQYEFLADNPTGNIEKLTFGVCYEITEEYMLDNDFPPNL